MSWVPAEQVIAAVQNQRQTLAQEQQRINNFAQYHATERAKLEAERAAALRDLGAAVLPRLDAPSIAAAAQAVGLVGLPAEDVPARLEARRAWLANRMTAILHDPRYANRELLRHPRTGSLMTAIAQNEDYKRPAAALIATCEQHPRFERLWTSGFGTPECPTAWWRYSYWQDRAAADALLKTFEGKTTFAEIRDDYTKAKADVSVFDGELAGLRQQVADGEALEREYATLYDEHHNIDARGLEHTRGRIVEHLLTSDPGLVSQKLRATPATSSLLMLFLRASGVGAKISYLDGIQQTNINQLQQAIQTQAQKLTDVEARTRRRWGPMPLDKFQKLNEDRRPWYEKRWQRFGKTYQTVYVYDRWDRGRYYDDLLWWDLMTRGRYDGSYLSDVSYFHNTHPGYQYNPDWKGLQADQRAAYDASDYETSSDDTDAAAAVADADAGDLDATNDQVDTTSTDAS